MTDPDLARYNLAWVIDPMAFDDGPFSTDAGDKQRQHRRQGIALALADNIIAAGWIKPESVLPPRKRSLIRRLYDAGKLPRVRGPGDTGAKPPRT